MTDQKHIHIIGICGVGTSGLAIGLKNAGHKVTGSDKGFFPPISTMLEDAGVNFYAGWHPEKMTSEGDPDFVVIGTASGSGNPETAYVKKHNIPFHSFAEAVGKFIVKENNSVVVAGTWGKTSSTAILSFILEKAGLKPSYFFGGVALSLPNGKINRGTMSIVEGDEYKSAPWDNSPKFAYYKPTHLLLTAVSWDHADLYPTEDSYFRAFEKLVSSIPLDGKLVANTDNDGVLSVLGSLGSKQYDRRIAYGKIERSFPTYTYKDVRQNKNGITFKITDINLTEYEIFSPMLGEFQAENITGCFAMAREIGIEPATIIKAIGEFKGMKRRLEKRHEGDITVIDDIAHSPEKATSVLSTLRKIYQGKIFVVFEPNIGGRQKEAVSKYDNAFKDADQVIIPRLTKLKTSNLQLTTDPMGGNELTNVISKTHGSAFYIDNDDTLVHHITSHAKKGDVIAFLGSHGFRGMIEETIKKLSAH